MSQRCAGAGVREELCVDFCNGGKVGVVLVSFGGAALGRVTNGTGEGRRNRVARMALKYRQCARAPIR